MRYDIPASSKTRLRLLAAVLLVFLCIAAKKKKTPAAADPPPATEVFIRLVSASQTANEVPILIAKFVPVTINYGGGGKGPGRPKATESKAGDEFTINFRSQKIDAHERTLENVIRSCEAPGDPGKLKLNLLLLVPSAAPKEKPEAEHDFSQWIITSVDVPE